MALAPVVAAALNVGLPARTKMLTVNGLDVLKQPGTSPVYGVDIESIHVSDAGAGDVSYMRFTITDPTGVLSAPVGAYVSFFDITANLPIFAGFVDTFTTTRLGVGRSIDVECIGIECVLDWMVVPSFSMTAADSGVLIQALVAQATGIGFAMNVASDPSVSIRATPLYTRTITSQLFTFTGVTLRQAIQTITDAMTATSVANDFATPVTHVATVDAYGGLRVFPNYAINTGVAIAWSDGVTLSLTTAGVDKPSDTTAITTAAEAQSVYVAGGNAAGTGLYSFGDGIGRVAYISDPNSLTAAYAYGLAISYRSRHGGTIQGTVTAEERWTIAITAWAGGAAIAVTDTQSGLAGTAMAITRIEKDYLPNGNEWWVISFGAMLRLGSTEMRRLTRTVLN